MTEAQHGPRRHQTRADRTLEDLALLPELARRALGDWGEWRATLKAWADGAPFPSGGNGRGGAGGHSDPTARAALAEDQTAWELIRADEDYKRAQDAVKAALSAFDSLVRRRAWVVNPAKPPEKSYLIFCENPRCQERIREELNERSREGRCQRCYRWSERYGREYPMKEVVRREAG